MSGERWLITYDYRLHRRRQGKIMRDVRRGTFSEVIDCYPTAWLLDQRERYQALLNSKEPGEAMSDIVVRLAVMEPEPPLITTITVAPP